MNQSKFWGISLLAVLLIGAANWWATAEDRNDPLNKDDAFVYSDGGMLYWFDVTSRNGKVEGKLHKQTLIDETGSEPFLMQESYPLTGKTTEKGYEFQVEYDSETLTYDAWFSGPHLAVQKQGERAPQLYNPVNQKELKEYETALLDYNTEAKEKARISEFFTKLRSVYGFLYTAEDGSYQLFVKIDEALLQGELSGSLLVMTPTDGENNPYQETKYVLNGITDGNTLRFYTKVDGNETKLLGQFYKDVTGFDLSFWKTDDKLSFHAVTEEEFKRGYEEFQTKVK